MSKATIARTKDCRTQAELRDDGELLAPQVFVSADEDAHSDAIEAVAVAVGENPNAVDEPRIVARYGEWGDLAFIFRPNELPVVRDGQLEGWLAPYRAQERITETLHRELPEGWTFEVERQGVLILAQE